MFIVAGVEAESTDKTKGEEIFVVDKVRPKKM